MGKECFVVGLDVRVGREAFEKGERKFYWLIDKK